MKLITQILLVFLFFSCTKQVNNADIVITNINVIDPVDQKITPHQKVLIKDGAISGILSTDDDLNINRPDSLIIDGTDKYIPIVI